MLDKVYVVMVNDPDEGHRVESVWTTYELAQEYVDSIELPEDRYFEINTEYLNCKSGLWS